LRDGAAGLFLAASKFPKNRETRAPLVLELKPHRAEIAEKYRFLLDAPERDPEGRPVVIRYSRKSAEHYVQTEIEGKPSGWRAFYHEGVWRAETMKQAGPVHHAAKEPAAAKKAAAPKKTVVKKAPVKKAAAKTAAAEKPAPKTAAARSAAKTAAKKPSEKPATEKKAAGAKKPAAKTASKSAAKKPAAASTRKR